MSVVMKSSLVSRCLLLGGYLFVALGAAVELYVSRHTPSRYLVYPISLFIAYLFMGSAWWICISALREAMSSEKTVRWGLVLFGLAGGVLFLGNLWFIWDWTGGWDFLFQASTAIGYLAVTAGFWVAARPKTVEDSRNEPSAPLIVAS
jgi:hypothetical protein